MKETFIQKIKHNWKSGLSVALVSVPLSLSLSIASGAGPLPGIITAIWAGLVASLIGGSNFNIVGPAGALTGILAGYAFAYGTPAVLPIIAIIAGIFSLVAWFFRWDRYLVFIPSAVVHGFTLGVAITIVSGQLNFLLGLSGLPKHERLIQNIVETFKHIGQASPETFGLFSIGLLLMFALMKFVPRLPNSIIVAFLGIVLGGLIQKYSLPIHVLTLKDVYGQLSLHLISLPHFDHAFLTLDIVKAGAIVAFVSVLETLISAKVADGMTKTKFNERKEVLGVALANIAAGVAGGIPASGVFARTAINVKSGATSNTSQFINAIAVAVISLLLIPWFSYIPLAVIASILVYASIRMIAKEHFSKLFKFDRVSFGLSLFVAGLVVMYDATTGILVGAVVSLVLFAQKLSRAQCLITTHGDDTFSLSESSVETSKDAIVYRFAGELTYVNSKAHTEAVYAAGKDATSVILNMKNLFYIDTDGMEALEEIVHNAFHNRQHVFVTGAHQVLMPILETMKWFTKLEKEGMVLGTSYEAVQKAISLKNLRPEAPHKTL